MRPALAQPAHLGAGGVTMAASRFGCALIKP